MCIAGRSAGQADTASSAEDSSLVIVQRLGINSVQSDFAPFYNGKKLYFVSGRVNKVGVQYADLKGHTEITDIYESAVKDPKRPASPKPVRGVNSKYHEGPLTMSKAGDLMFFTGNDVRSQLLKIFVSENRNGSWSKPEVLPFCTDTFTFCHPALSSSGDTIYLSTNCRGRGKMDICYAVKQNSNWGPVLPLAGHVNSADNELFPYLAAGNQLYFASDRSGGLGGLDIYRSDVSDTVRHAELLYPPINSGADDFGICADSTGQSGYFSSNRSPRSGDDIYYFSRSIPDFSRADAAPVRNRFCYTFYEETSMVASDTINNIYQWSFGDGTTAIGLSNRHCYQRPGIYNVELNVIQKSSGEVDSSLVKYQIEIAEPEQLRISCPDTVSAGSAVSLSSTGSAIKGFEITGRYWSFGDGFYNEGTEARHIFRREGKYIVELWIVAAGIQDHKTHKFRHTKTIVVEKPR